MPSRQVNSTAKTRISASFANVLSRLARRPGDVIVRFRKIALQRRALRHRIRLGREQSAICWIGVTGSCGKSTTCRILAQMLAKHAPCRLPNLLWNYTGTVPLAILNVTAEDRFVVQEIATHVPGSIERICKMYLPQIGVVMNVGTDHYTQFGGQEAIAQEKAALVRALPADGVAILNADDSRVAAMAKDTVARPVTFGIENAATYRARDVSAAWPRGVSFVLEHDGQTHHVETGLFGAHFAPNVLASLATAHTAGMPLKDAVAALGDVEPLEGRMSEVKAPDGVTFIRDDYKAPWWGLPFTVDFIKEAQSDRKVLVLGEMSDNPGDKATKFRRVINSALDHVDRIVVVGPAGRKLNSALLEHQRVEPFETIENAHHYLESYLKSGDLVVLKGMIADHLERLARARVENVGCWRSRCGRKHLCSECDLLELPAGPDDPPNSTQ